MPIRFERSVDDPIVTLIFVDPLDTPDIQDANTQITQLLTEMGVLYMIIDIRDAEITFGESIALLEGPETPGLTTEPRIKFVFLGAPILHDPTNQQHVPVFAARDEAVDYLLQEIASRAHPDSE